MTNEITAYCLGSRKEDCTRYVGQVLKGKRGMMIVIRASEPVDTDSGQKPWSQEYVMRPCTREEAAAAATAEKIARLERTISALAGGPDDERGREQHDERLRAAKAELAKLTG